MLLLVWIVSEMFLCHPHVSEWIYQNKVWMEDWTEIIWAWPWDLALIFTLPSYVLSITSPPPWQNNAIVRLSWSLASTGNLTNCWICHSPPGVVFSRNIAPIIIPMTNFFNAPNYTIYCDRHAFGIAYWVQIFSHAGITPSLAFSWLLL